MLMMLLKLDMFEDPTVPAAEPVGPPPVVLPITELLVLFVVVLDTLGLLDDVYEGWFECPVEEAPWLFC